jgi:hypothetical protein
VLIRRSCRRRCGSGSAKVFGEETGTKVAVKAGPPAAWMEDAKRDADLVFSGSENMMTDFVNALSGQIHKQSRAAHVRRFPHSEAIIGRCIGRLEFVVTSDSRH